MECWRVRGGLCPAALTALTRTKIFDSVVSPEMVYLVFSVNSVLATIQSSAEMNQQFGEWGLIWEQFGFCINFFLPFTAALWFTVTLRCCLVKCLKMLLGLIQISVIRGCLTSFYAVLHDVSVQASSSDVFGRTPLYGHWGVSDVIHDQHGGLAGYSWMEIEVVEIISCVVYVVLFKGCNLFLDMLLVVLAQRQVFTLQRRLPRRHSSYVPRGIKALDGSLGLDTPIPLTAKIRSSYGTPSIIFLGSNDVSLIKSKFSLIHRELCFFFLSMK